jgi:hypothetical protein
VLGALAAVPSIILAYVVVAILKVLSIDTAGLIPDLSLDSPSFVLVLIVVAPLVETVVVIVALKVIRILVKSPTLSSSISGVGWGIAHGLQAPLWFFGTFWSFFVFSRAYLTWRNIGRSRGFGAACLPHAIQNTVVYTLIRVSGSA